LLCEFEQTVDEKTKVEEIYKEVIKRGFKNAFDINRLRLKIGDDKGRALADKGKSILSELKDGPEMLDVK
jgi:hypothetical protein